MDFVNFADSDFVDITSGADNIIVMRHKEAFGSTSYQMSFTMKQRELSDSELIKKARTETEKRTITSGVDYFMYLSGSGGCIVFDNHSGGAK